jgi:maleate isomerase
MAERKRIGIILPSVNNVLESDFADIVPDGYTYHTTRMPVISTGMTLQSLRDMNESIEDCADLLSHCGMNVLVYGCTSGSFMEGPGYDQKIIALIESTSGLPAIATAAASAQAMHFLELKRISIVTPYPDEVNQTIPAFFEGNGFEVMSITGRSLGVAKSEDIWNDPPDKIAQFAIEHCASEADGLFMSCTSWNAFSVADQVEQAIGRPVVTSNQATIWATFRKLGYAQRLSGHGKLLREGFTVSG